MTGPSAPDLLVVCLCAAWCTTCNEFRVTWDRLAGTHPGAAFHWLDIEDDSALIGDLEIENFPTLAVFRGDAPMFFGPSMPQEGVIARTLASLGAGERVAVDVPVEIAALPAAMFGRRQV